MVEFYHEKNKLLQNLKVKYNALFGKQRKIDLSIFPFCLMFIDLNSIFLKKVLSSLENFDLIVIIQFSFFPPSLILLKFNKEDVFPELRKTTRKMKP